MDAVWKVFVYLIALVIVSFGVCVPLIPVVGMWAVAIQLAWLFASTAALIIWIGD